MKDTLVTKYIAFTDIGASDINGTRAYVPYDWPTDNSKPKMCFLPPTEDAYVCDGKMKIWYD